MAPLWFCVAQAGIFRAVRQAESLWILFRGPKGRLKGLAQCPGYQQGSAA